VDPKISREYLDYLAERLDAFVAAFDELMTLHVENAGPLSMARGIAPAAFPKDGSTPQQIDPLASELHLLAGALMDLSTITGVWIRVEGVGKIDPFVNWATILQPKPLMEASDVRACAFQATGRLEGLKAKAEALAAPDLDPVHFHPLVWASAQRLWNDGHRRQAVAAAAEAVSGQMKQLTDRNDGTDTSLWQQAFSERGPVEGKPRLRWPGDPADQDVRSMNDGLRQFAPGANMVIRNPATHKSGDLAEQAALERLATLSLLAHMVDGCVVESIPDRGN